MQETDKEIFEKDAKDYLPVFNRYKIVLDHGEGAYLWDNNGKKYLDFLGGIAVNVLGHDYGPLVTAISEQAKKLIHCSNLYYTQPQADAAAKLVALSGLDKAFFGTIGITADGLSTTDPGEAYTKKLMLRRAHKAILLADSGKFGCASLVASGSLRDLDIVITDRGLSPEFARLLRRNKIEVVTQ